MAKKQKEILFSIPGKKANDLSGLYFMDVGLWNSYKFTYAVKQILSTQLCCLWVSWNPDVAIEEGKGSVKEMCRGEWLLWGGIGCGIVS